MKTHCNHQADPDLEFSTTCHLPWTLIFTRRPLQFGITVGIFGKTVKGFGRKEERKKRKWIIWIALW
jgi:hypothetical protein